MKRTLPLLLLFSTALSAQAAELVLYGPGETPSTATAKTSLLAGRTPADLEARTLTQLVEGTGPVALGGATLQTCPGDTGTNAAISLILEKIESAMLFMEIEAANAGLDAVVSMEQCLTEVLDPAVISRVHYLRGMVAVGSGNQANAWPEFVQSAILNPEIEWDDNFPPDGKGAFNGARSAVKVAQAGAFEVFPPPDGSIWVNGQPAAEASLSLVAGTHVIQIGASNTAVATYTVGIPEDSHGSLVFPENVKDDHISLVNQANTRGLLEGLLLANSHGAQTFVSLPGQVLWQFDPAARTWTPLAGVDEAQAADASSQTEATDSVADAVALEAPGEGMSRRTLYLAGGGGLVATGGALLGAGLSQAAKVNPDKGYTPDELTSFQTKANTLGGMGMAMGALGAGLLGLGVFTDGSKVALSVGGSF